ncbi:MAG: phosphate signaling complex protein PhoU [Acidimicrobiales bacterium]
MTFPATTFPSALDTQGGQHLLNDTRRSFHADLESLHGDVLRLASLAANAIDRGTIALLRADLAAALDTIEADLDLDDLTARVNEKVADLLARQAPVAADMRLLVTVLRAVHELERVGDLMVGVAKAARRLYPAEIGEPAAGIIARMAAEAQVLVSVAVAAFATRDALQAEGLAHMDDVVDDLARELLAAIMASGARDEAGLALAVSLALVGRAYERVADHAVNIAQRVAYLAQ